MTANVTVYGQPGCAPCGATKRALDTLGVEYDYVDIRSRPLTPAETQVVYRYGKTPIVVAGTLEWSGHHPELLKGLTDLS